MFQNILTKTIYNKLNMTYIFDTQIHEKFGHKFRKWSVLYRLLAANLIFFVLSGFLYLSP